jgi:DNA topoisomerase-2
MTVSTNGFQQVSFVNSIATSKGGTHVNYITDQMVKAIGPIVAKKNKAASVKNHQIKAHLWVFVNCLIENPSFDSQTKENHTLAASKFGSKAVLGTKFLKKMEKSGIVDNILVWAKVKGQELMSKKSGGAKRSRITGIPKLDDANEAGSRNSRKCTLILTEGDSAKTLALSGLSVIGRDYYGVFPLKGKPLNVREATMNQVLANQVRPSITRCDVVCTCLHSS